MGEKLSEIARVNINKKLSKGEDMTGKDVKYLVRRGVSRKEILRNMGLNITEHNARKLREMIKESK